MHLISKICIIIILLFKAFPVYSGDIETILIARRATVKISKTYIKPNYCIPWKMKTHSSSVGSGVIIPGNMILTNAHIVSDATYIGVQKENDPKRYEAYILYIGHECDLALLRVKDLDFFHGTVELELGDIPRLKSKVATIGYPVGGERISITEGIVSRIEIGTYSHSRKSSLLMVQTDAAINPGNSGGPVIQNGKIAGIAFQAISDSNNIGYMIPTPIIRHFLRDISDGRFDGFPDIGIFTQNLINEDFRNYLGMSKEDTGIIVTHVIHGSSSQDFLKSHDVLLRIDSKDIANDGSISYRDGRILYTIVVDNKQMGENVTFDILRDRQLLTITFPLEKTPVRIPWFNEYETLPRYYIFGGIVFQPINREYLRCWDKWWVNADRRILYYFSYLERDNIDPVRKEFIVINQILSDSVNSYISDINDTIVSRINGIKITTLDNLIKAFEKPIGLFHIIEVEGRSKQIVLKASMVDQANKRILKKYQIPSDRRLNKFSGYGKLGR